MAPVAVDTQGDLSPPPHLVVWVHKTGTSKISIPAAPSQSLYRRRKRKRREQHYPNISSFHCVALHSFPVCNLLFARIWTRAMHPGLPQHASDFGTLRSTTGRRLFPARRSKQHESRGKSAPVLKQSCAISARDRGPTGLLIGPIHRPCPCFYRGAPKTPPLLLAARQSTGPCTTFSLYEWDQNAREGRPLIFSRARRLIRALMQVRP